MLTFLNLRTKVSFCPSIVWRGGSALTQVLYFYMFAVKLHLVKYCTFTVLQYIF